MEICIVPGMEVIKNTKSKTVVVWGEEDLLNFSFQYFLAGKEDWTVIRISNYEELDAFFLAMETTPTDIIIIHQRGHNDHYNFTLHLLQDHPVIKIIALSLENNAMEVYSKKKTLIKHVSDLISAIESEP